jgi:hypothetical protein
LACPVGLIATQHHAQNPIDPVPASEHRAPLSSYRRRIDVKGGVRDGVLTAELTGRNPGFSFAEDTDDLFVENVSSWGCPHVAYEDITNIGVY